MTEVESTNALQCTDDVTANGAEPSTPIIHSDSSNTAQANGAFTPEIETIEEKQTWLENNRCDVSQNGCRIVSHSYQYLNVISEGVYGVVHRAKCRKTGDIVALKKIKVHKTRSGFPQSSLREINILSQLHHENIISVREVVIDSNYVDIFMVMDYAANDIQSIMHNNATYCSAKEKTIKWYWPLAECKCLMFQLLNGLSYLHSQFILHRDLKTSNLLLSNRGVLKICDFGMSRPFSYPLRPYTNYVVTLWYRAPELLLAADKYGPPIDVWSVGCILAELLTGKVLFPGDGEFRQINLIFALLGTPTEEEWPKYPTLPHGPNKFSWRIMKRKIDDRFAVGSRADEIQMNNGNHAVVDEEEDNDVEMKNNHNNNNNNNNNGDEEKRTFTPETVGLLKQLLIYDPAKRITAQQALSHPFFTTELPKMTLKQDMPSFKEHHVSHQRKEKRPDDVAHLNKANDNDEAASC